MNISDLIEVRVEGSTAKEGEAKKDEAEKEGEVEEEGESRLKGPDQQQSRVQLPSLTKAVSLQLNQQPLPPGQTIGGYQVVLVPWFVGVPQSGNQTQKHPVVQQNGAIVVPGSIRTGLNVQGLYGVTRPAHFPSPISLQPSPMGLQPVEGGTTSVRPTSADRIQFRVGNTRNSGDGRQWSVGSLGSVGEEQESQFRLGPSVIPQPPPQSQQQPTKIITRGEGSSLNVLADVMLKDGSSLSNPSTPDLEAGQSPPPPPNIYNHVLTVPPVHQGGDIGRGSRAKAHLEVDAPGRPHHCIYHGLSREEALEIHGVVIKEVCYARFRRRQEMLRHVRSVHGGAGDKVWVCPGGERGLCNRRFARADALRRHLESIRCREEKDGCSYGMSDEEIGRLVRAAKE